MGFFWRLIIGIVVSAMGLYCLVKTRRVIHHIGYNNWAEAHIGGGGTYILVKFIGIAAMVLSILFIIGVFKNIVA